MNNDKPAVALPDFGDYVTIEQKRFGAPNEFWDYKVIGRLESNTWTDVPVTPTREVQHDNCEPIILAVADNLSQEDVRRFRVADVKLRAKPTLAQGAAPAVMEALPTDAMVDAYLTAQRAYIEAEDAQWSRPQRPNIGGMHTNMVRESCRAGLVAAGLAATQPAVAVEAGWKPIETAPKDGTHILLANKEGTSEGGWLTDIDHGADWEGQIGMAGWWRVDGTDWTNTHWRHLPSAPGAAPINAAAEFQKALDMLAGLHPGLTIDGPPMDVAERIFGAVMAEQRALKDEIANMERNLEGMRRHLGKPAAAPTAQPEAGKPLTDAQIEKLRDATFSINNPFCPVDSKSMRKAVRATERAHGIGGNGGSA